MQLGMIEKAPVGAFLIEQECINQKVMMNPIRILPFRFILLCYLYNKIRK